MNKIKLTDLKKDMMKAKKEDKFKANVLMMLIDTIEKLAKEKEPINTNYDKYIKEGLKKYIKQVEDAIKNGMENAKKELEILKKYAEKILPPQLSEIELKHIIIEFINDNPQAKIGQIMGYLKKTFADRVDMKKASQIVNQILKGE
jgi:uncharacterized protein YqeY